MRIDILTLFPETVKAILGYSVIYRAIEERIVTINVINFRDYSKNKHKKVDDYSYGGGAGMLLAVQPIYDALQSIEGIEHARKLITTPQGKPYNQQKAMELSKESHIVIVCGHYEGMDHRVLDYIDEEVSIGDYILTGGEFPAMVIADSIIRLLPGALNNVESSEIESFSEGLLEYPQFTRPVEFQGKLVPDVLISGNHEEIRKWRKKASIERTLSQRPELLEVARLDQEGKAMLEEVKKGTRQKINRNME
ncbi:MAG TPA: tRNA (guanosine(37)-N1)-methyltransferase TrmD [Bacilli bacterium]|mgnify:CR=1 FL=1|nr:tRNA (guanosine(37)-N1)-methyltransferase TrmD [Bacilli bacterium]